MTKLLSIRPLRLFLEIVSFPVVFSLIFISAIIGRVIKIATKSSNINKNSRKIILGSAPIKNNTYWSRALRRCGYNSKTFVTSFHSNINSRDDWDRLLVEEYPFVPSLLKPYTAFAELLLTAHIVIIPFSGIFLGNTVLRSFQSLFFKVAGIRTIVIPYGADSYVYGRIRSLGTLQGLLCSYPEASRKQEQISRNVNYWVRNADCVVTGLMSEDGFGRWDVLIPSALFIDVDEWYPSIRNSNENGLSGKVIIAHAPNHRGFKGSEFVIEAVKKLNSEGLNVELKLIENVQNSTVKSILSQEVDILVDQLICSGYALNSLEGMACGLPVVGNFENEEFRKLMSRWSFLSECPIVSSEPENIVDVLRKLVLNPNLRAVLGKASRQYVEKYHSLDACEYFFTSIISSIDGEPLDLIKMYHPLHSEFCRRLPRINHPLVDGRIQE